MSYCLDNVKTMRKGHAEPTVWREMPAGGAPHVTHAACHASADTPYISVKEESGMCRKAIPDCRIILKQSSSNSLSLCFWYTRINAVKCSDFQITYPYVSLFFILNVRKHSLSKIQYVVYPSHTYKRAHSYRHTSSGVTPSARCHPCRIP